MAFSASQKREIYHRESYTCQWSGCRKFVPISDAEFHHVIPSAMGGADIVDNGALLHGRCHSSNYTALHGKLTTTRAAVVPKALRNWMYNRKRGKAKGELVWLEQQEKQ